MRKGKVDPEIKAAIMQIVLEEATRSGFSTDRLLSKARDCRVVEARHAVFYRCAHETAGSSEDIGAVLKCHHTTILYGVDQHAIRLGQSPRMRRNRISTEHKPLAKSLLESIRMQTRNVAGHMPRLSRDRFHITMGALRTAFRGRDFAGVKADDFFHDIDVILSAFRDVVTAAKITAKEENLVVRPDSALGRAIKILETVGE